VRTRARPALPTGTARNVCATSSSSRTRREAAGRARVRRRRLWLPSDSAPTTPRQPCPKALLWTSAANIPARKLFETAGVVPTRRKEPQFVGVERLNDRLPREAS